MTTDAKFGLLAGVAAVLLVAVIYQRKPQAAVVAPTGELPAVKAAVVPPQPVSVVPKPNEVPTPEPADPLLRRPLD